MLTLREIPPFATDAAERGRGSKKAIYLDFHKHALARDSAIPNSGLINMIRFIQSIFGRLWVKPRRLVKGKLIVFGRIIAKNSKFGIAWLRRAAKVWLKHPNTAGSERLLKSKANIPGQAPP
jgi:hypothetical protein